MAIRKSKDKTLQFNGTIEEERGIEDDEVSVDVYNGQKTEVIHYNDQFINGNGESVNQTLGGMDTYEYDNKGNLINSHQRSNDYIYDNKSRLIFKEVR